MNTKRMKKKKKKEKRNNLTILLITNANRILFRLQRINEVAIFINEKKRDKENVTSVTNLQGILEGKLAVCLLLLLLYYII